MTKNALVIQHVLAEDLGILQPVLRDHGYTITMVETPVHGIAAPQALDADLLVVLGGPIGVYETGDFPYLNDEIEAITRRLAVGAPTMGICLGAQLIAHALGATVEPTGSVEIGYGPLTLTDVGRHSVLAPLVDTPVLHWHGDQFHIPEGGDLLAHTPGFPHQAFSVGNHILGLQFHLEVDPTTIDRWIIANAGELATHGISPDALRRDAAQYGPALVAAGQQVFDAWLAGASA